MKNGKLQFCWAARVVSNIANTAAHPITPRALFSVASSRIPDGTARPASDSGDMTAFWDSSDDYS